MPQVVSVQFTVPTEDPDEAIATVKAMLGRLDQADPGTTLGDSSAPTPLRCGVRDAPTGDETPAPQWRVSSVRREAATTGVWRPS